MSLSGKIISQIPITSDTNLFYELWKNKPHHITNLSPDIIQDCVPHEGDFGTVGSIIHWHFFLDGKNRVDKVLISALNEEKKLITFKVLEGHLLELYKTLDVTLHIETIGDDLSFATWTVDYEKLNQNFSEPYSFLEMLTKLTRDIIAGHTEKTND